MKILYIKVNEDPEVIEIETALKAMQELVDGPIEIFCPFDDPEIAIICNEEGKLNCAVNRAVIIDGNCVDIIYGDFFICKAPVLEENFTSLTEEELDYYAKKFALPF